MCGQIFVDSFVGPHVLPYRHAGNNYRYFLIYDLLKLPTDVPLAVRSRTLYMHDGAPARFSRAVRDVRSNTYHDRWINRGGPNARPPWSPDLNPLNFNLQGHLKTLVYAAPVDKEEALHHRIVGCLSDYPQLPRHLWMDAAVRDETCRGGRRISWRAFWVLIINVLFQL
jgi:hypothetical protein